MNKYNILIVKYLSKQQESYPIYKSIIKSKNNFTHFIAQ